MLRVVYEELTGSKRMSSRVVCVKDRDADQQQEENEIEDD
jgi:hypothetical protein